MKFLLKLLSAIALALVFVVNTSFIDLRSDRITFTGYFGDELLVKDKNYFCTAKSDSISVSTCRFYVTEIVLFEDGLPVGTFDGKLIDLFDTTTNRFRVPFYSHGVITEIHFNLGVDSAHNVAGAGEGDFDPTKGMYWAWQSGFINMKLEGKSPLCTKGKGEFQYHLGGYRSPHNALQTVVVKVPQDNGDFRIKVDVQKFFELADMSTTSNVMSPSLRATELSAIAAQMFSLEK